jgi:pimeloyl-ACP methyl ester carboxylesterase
VTTMPTSEFTTRDGCVLRYRDTGGDGPALVLLHGWSQSQAMFDRLLPRLPGLRVVTYDMRNHGLSGRTPNGPRIGTLAADLAELVSGLGIERAHFLGHSMGASVLWSYLDLFGNASVESLTIVDQPSVCAILPGLTAGQAGDVGAILDFAGAEAFCTTLLGEQAAEARRAFLLSMLTPDIPAEDVEWLYEQNLLLPMPWGAQLLLDHVMQDWRDVLPRVGVPTLVIGGEVSHVASSSQRWTAAQIPGARLRVFTREEGGAHFAFFESPEHFAAELLDFLAAAPAVV